MPKVPKPKGSFKGKKKKIITTVAIILLLAAAVIAGVVVRLLQTPSTQTNQPQDNTEQRLPEVVSEVQDLQSEGKADEANKKAEEQLKNPSTSSDIKYMLYIQQGNGKFNNGDFTGSITEYEKALAIKETYEITNLLGSAYAQAGNNAKAIEFYKKALSLVPADSPTAADEKESLKQTITSLGGQP